jgi:hypothetical protein
VGPHAGVFAGNVKREMTQGTRMMFAKVTPTLMQRYQVAADMSGTTVTTLTRAALRATISAIEKGAREARLVTKPSVTNGNGHVAKKWIRGHWRRPRTSKLNAHSKAA